MRAGVIPTLNAFNRCESPVPPPFVATQTADTRLDFLTKYSPQFKSSCSAAAECRNWANFSLIQVAKC